MHLVPIIDLNFMHEFVFFWKLLVQFIHLCASQLPLSQFSHSSLISYKVMMLFGAKEYTISKKLLRICL